MKHIVKYKLYAGTVPYFIEDGGMLGVDGWLYGISKDDYDCNIPSDAIKISKNDFINYMKSIKMKKIVEVELTDQEKIDIIDNILDKHNMKEK